MSQRLTFLLLCVGVVAAPVRVAIGHTLKVQRQLSFESHGADLHILGELSVPAGMPKRVLITLADADHDGRLNTREREDLEDILAERLFAGIQLSMVHATHSTTIAWSPAQRKLRIDETSATPAKFMAHAVRQFSTKSPRIAIAANPNAEAVSIRILSGNRPVTHISERAFEWNPRSLHFHLERGKRVQWMFGDEGESPGRRPMVVGVQDFQ